SLYDALSISQLIIGIIIIIIYYFTFKFLILKFDVPISCRDDNSETTLYTKEDYKNKKAGEEPSKQVDSINNEYTTKADIYLKGLGGTDNIIDITNCAT